jgi:hypothetical protein
LAVDRGIVVGLERDDVRRLQKHNRGETGVASMSWSRGRTEKEVIRGIHVED